MTLTADEQYLLELINRARLDPQGEAARYGIDLNQGLASGTLAGGSRQVLAPNAQLELAAQRHSQWMLATDIFSHTGAGGSQPWDRASAAGYAWRGIAENISWRGTTSSVMNAESMVLSHHEGLFRSAGHRVNMLNNGYREIGLDRATGQFLSNGTNWNASMLTELFGASGTQRFLTGVAYNDLDADRFYSIGEGLGGARFTVGAATAVTSGAGGYSLGITSVGPVALSGLTAAGLRFTATVDMSLGNVKLDVLGGNEFLSSGSLTLGVGIHRATLLGLNSLSLTGNAAHNILNGNAGANVILGMDGSDTIFGGGGNDSIGGGVGNDRLSGVTGNDTVRGGQGNDLLDGGAGNDLVSGGVGADTLTGGANADRFEFLDMTGADRITDFRLAEGDRLIFDDALWNGRALTGAQVVQSFARVTTAGVLFDFGADGSVLLAGVTTLSGLTTAIDIV